MLMSGVGRARGAMITDYHAKYFAHELTKRCAPDSAEKLAGAVAGAQVDLNPHQIDAALFAFSSPLSKGAILADEVGPGKTIEAGILLSQRWVERKRQLLVNCCKICHGSASSQLLHFVQQLPPDPRAAIVKESLAVG